MVKLDGTFSRHEVAGDGWNGYGRAAAQSVRWSGGVDTTSVPGVRGWLSTFYGRADLDPVALLPLQGLDGQNGTAPWVAPATTTVCGQDMVAAVFPSAISPTSQGLGRVRRCVRAQAPWRRV